MKRFSVTALGELLVDFCENDSMIFEAKPGGAPCNVLAMCSKLGKSTAFIGKVGKDMFGEMLLNAVNEAGIYSGGLVFDERVKTTLAFVHNSADGEREFSFYRNPGADMMLEKSDVNKDLIKNSSIFHFGTLSSTHEKCREATRYALDMAKVYGCLISFDPNLRERLWSDLGDAVREIKFGLGKCNILKIADNELEFLEGFGDYDEKMGKLMRENTNIKLAFLTMGKRGARAYYNGEVIISEAFAVNSIDTTGAGDTFTGCVLSYLAEHDVESLTKENIAEMLCFANAAAALVTEKQGALTMMPSLNEIEKLMRR